MLQTASRESLRFARAELAREVIRQNFSAEPHLAVRALLRHDKQSSKMQSGKVPTREAKTIF